MNESINIEKIVARGILVSRNVYEKIIQNTVCVNARHLFVGLECKGRVANWTLNKGKRTFISSHRDFPEFVNNVHGSPENRPPYRKHC